MKIYGGTIAHAHTHAYTTHDGGATAQLQRQLTALQSHLQHAFAILPRVRRLCETSRLENTQYFTYTTTTHGDDDGDGDGDGVASLESRMQEILSDVERLQCEAMQRMRQRERRRESLVIKMEPMEEEQANGDENEVKGSDTDETDDELLLIKMMERADVDDDGDAMKKKTFLCDSAQAGATPAVVTPRAVDSEPEKGQYLTQTMAQDTTSGSVTAHQKLQAQLEELGGLVIAADKTHCHARASKSRGTITITTRAMAEIDTETLQRALDNAMDILLRMEMTLEMVPSVLRLHEAMLHIRHATLKTTLSSPIQILHSLISSLPETIGGLTHTCRSLTRDGVAQELFAAAVDLLTTTSQRRRTELVDHVLRELKSGFKAWIVVRKIPSKSKKRRDDQQKAETKWTVTVPWAGRVLLLVAHIVAYVITTHEHSRMERFQGILRVISARHALFPVLLERAKLIVMKPPLPCCDGTSGDSQHRTRRLHLKHESQRILQICARACAE